MVPLISTSISTERIQGRFAGHLLTCLLLASGNGVAAQREEAVSEAYFFEELPVVLGATRLAQPLADSPTAMTVIDREMIKASGAMSIPDLLRLVPGFTVGFYSGMRASASYHGLADQYARDMQVLLDGRSIYDPGYGGVCWPDMPIDMDEINRIEVIRGPNATAYGSNSYAGVINIITQHPADTYGGKLIATAGNDGRRKLYGRYARQVSDFGILLSTAYEDGDGFPTREDDYNYRWFNLHGDKQLDAKNQLQLTLGASRGSYEEGYSAPLQDIRDLDNHYQYQHLKWLHEESDANRLQLQLYHNHLKIKDAYESPKLSEMILALDDLQAIPEPLRLDAFATQMGAANFEDFLNALNITDSRFLISWLGLESHRYDLELEQTLMPVAGLRLAWGLGLRRDEARSDQIFHRTDPVARNQARLFVNTEWRATEQFVFNLGGMFEDYQAHAPLFSYRAAANYHLDHQNTFRINASRAYRIPTLYEEHVNFVIFLGEPFNDINTWFISQHDLDPQSLNSLEIGYFGNYFNDALTLDVKLFKERYGDMIIAYRDFDYPDPDRGLADPTVLNNFNLLVHRGAQSYLNAGKTDIYGLEVSAQYKPTHRDLIYFGYSYMHTKGKELQRIKEGIATYHFDINTHVPTHTFSLLGSHLFDNGVQISATYYFTDTMTWAGEGDPIPSYRRLDTRLSKHFSLAQKNAEVSLLIQGINRDNYDFFKGSRYTNIQETNAFLQFSVEL